MFTVRTPDEVFTLIRTEFSPSMPSENVPLDECCGRILAEDIAADEYVPGFSRSTVDGYAVKSADTFGCSDSIPALLTLSGEIKMGEDPGETLEPGCCYYVPTGGALPDGADAAVMFEYTEDYGDGTIGILKPASPGLNMIHKGEDLFPGKVILPAGRRISMTDIGALAALGVTRIPVVRKPVAGIISTGDELIPIGETPGPGQIRDVNSHLLEEFCRQSGAEPRRYGIITDHEELLAGAVSRAIAECDIVLISGGSSVGVRDASLKVIEQHGKVLLHGIAMKPGKPTILGNANGKPVFGLPGHPVAAFFISVLYVREAIACLTGTELTQRKAPAVLTEAVSANHGRSEAMGVRLHRTEGTLYASPVHTKSGLISALAGTDGYMMIPRDCEGLSKGTVIDVYYYS